MPETETILQEYIYAVKKDLTYHYLTSIDTDIKEKEYIFVVKHIDAKTCYEDHWGKMREHGSARLVLLDLNNQIIEEFIEQNWKFKIRGFGHPYGRFSHTTMYVEFIDPFGSLEEERFEISLDGLIKAYRRFLYLCCHKELSSAKIHLKCDQLIAENQNLKQEIEILSKERDFFKDKLLSIAGITNISQN